MLSVKWLSGGILGHCERYSPGPELCSLYRVPQQSAATAVLGVIGKPVAQSKVGRCRMNRCNPR
jgi:hypothetical protein